MNQLSKAYFEGVEVGTSTKAYELAEQNGWEVVLPKINQLQLDIDDDAAFQVWAQHRKFLEKTLKITRVVETPSKSGESGKWHITVDLGAEISPADRITLQALLGSDRTREILSWIRLNREDKSPTLFYEKKEQHARSTDTK